MRLSNINNQGYLKGGLLQKIYETDIGTSATSITISSLDGNTDNLYVLVCRFVNDYNGTVEYGVRGNNDSGANYGYQTVSGDASSPAATRVTNSTYFYCAYVSAQNQVAHSEGWLYAKSGYIRTLLHRDATITAGTAVSNMRIVGQSWSNTADNLTSLVIVASQTNGLGVGTHIELWSLKRRS